MSNDSTDTNSNLNPNENRSEAHNRTTHSHLQVINHIQVINHHLQQLQHLEHNNRDIGTHVANSGADDKGPDWDIDRDIGTHVADDIDDIIPEGKKVKARTGVDIGKLVDKARKGELGINEIYNEMFGSSDQDQDSDQDEESENRDISSHVADIGGRPDDIDDRDWLIIQLNRQGLSSYEISKSLLAEDPPIELTPRSVQRRIGGIRNRYKDLVKVNNLQYNNAKPKSSFRWYKIVERLQTEIVEYTRQMGFKPSPRTMFYHLQDLKIIRPKDINYFTTVTVKARLRYKDSNDVMTYPILPIDCFADDDSRKTIDNYDGSEKPKEAVPGEIDDPIKNIEKMIDDLRHAANNFNGKAKGAENSQMGGRWYNQPQYVEIWEEKNDLLPGFLKILGDRNIKIRANKGYASLNFLRQCTIELKEEIVEGQKIDPKNIHILYCGDWDPSGAQMDYYMKARVRQLGLPEEIAKNFKRIAVTKEQISEYHLPLMPLEKGNPLTKEFERMHGPNAKATHLNAFFTRTHFDAFKKILLDAVDKYWDQEIYDELKKKYDDIAPKNEPEPYTEEQLKAKREELYRKITAAFAQGWYKDMPDAPYYW